MKTLAERAEEARLEEVAKRELREKEGKEQHKQNAITWFNKTLPEAKYIEGQDMFELEGVSFRYYNGPFQTDPGNPSYFERPYYLDGCGSVSFCDLAGYGEYLKFHKDAEERLMEWVLGEAERQDLAKKKEKEIRDHEAWVNSFYD